MADRPFRDRRRAFYFRLHRGAYTARSLSGLISKCGLLAPGAPLSVNQLYDRYRRHTAPTIRALQNNSSASADQPEASKLEDAWILRYCAAIDIKLIGVWNTVGSIGVPLWNGGAFNIARYRFLERHLRLTNAYAHHALALDEHRTAFKPTLWTRTVAHDAKATAPDRPLQDVEQRWFVGAHANVGGGYPSDLLAQAPLNG